MAEGESTVQHFLLYDFVEWGFSEVLARIRGCRRFLFAASDGPKALVRSPHSQGVGYDTFDLEACGR